VERRHEANGSSQSSRSKTPFRAHAALHGPGHPAPAGDGARGAPRNALLMLCAHLSWAMTNQLVDGVTVHAMFRQ
jgi:hypothetical protein